MAGEEARTTRIVHPSLQARAAAVQSEEPPEEPAVQEPATEETPPAEETPGTAQQTEQPEFDADAAVKQMAEKDAENERLRAELTATKGMNEQLLERVPVTPPPPPEPVAEKYPPLVTALAAQTQMDESEVAEDLRALVQPTMEETAKSKVDERFAPVEALQTALGTVKQTHPDFTIEDANVFMQDPSHAAEKSIFDSLAKVSVEQALGYAAREMARTEKPANTQPTEEPSRPSAADKQGARETQGARTPISAGPERLPQPGAGADSQTELEKLWEAAKVGGPGSDAMKAYNRARFGGSSVNRLGEVGRKWV